MHESVMRESEVLRLLQIIDYPSARNGRARLVPAAAVTPAPEAFVIIIGFKASVEGDLDVVLN